MTNPTITYDPISHLIEVRFSRVVDLRTVQEHLPELLAMVRRHDCRRILADCRSCTTQLSTFDLFSQQETSREVLSEGGLAPHQVKRAVVVAQPAEDGQFYEDVAVTRGHSIRVFTDRDAALRWLLDEQEGS